MFFGGFLHEWVGVSWGMYVCMHIHTYDFYCLGYLLIFLSSDICKVAVQKYNVAVNRNFRLLNGTNSCASKLA